jgi:hypothetical protein
MKSVVESGPVAVRDDITVEVTTDTSLPERLWGTPARAGTFGSAIAGGALIALGWVGASGTRVVSDQLPWLVTSIAGLGLAALGEGVWILSGRRTLGRGFVAVLPAPTRRAADAEVATDGRIEDPDDGALVAVEGRVGLYHRRACAFVQGKKTSPAPRAAHERAGLTPCEVCQP